MHPSNNPWRWHERLALAVYGGLMALARPLLRRKLARRARAEPGYAHDVPARLGWYADAASQNSSVPWLWVHAVSLGETRTAAVLIQALRQRQPGLRLLLTHSTATGLAEGQRLLQPGDRQTWLPWDDPWSVRRFLNHHRPALGVLMETEIWPVLLHEAHRAGVPLVLANARLNERSARGAQRLAWLSRPAYASLAAVGAQTPADAQRLQQVGVVAPQVWGNLKFDAQPDPDQQATARRWRQALQRPVVMLASSREGEEVEFFKEISDLPHMWQGKFATEKVVWLVVPRHPQRFDDVARGLQEGGAQVWRRADWGAVLDARHRPTDAAPTVWLGDSLGEMALYATLADVALLGGSFQPLGGQNLIELAACGCTVVAGPHTFNFADATEHAVLAGVAHRVPDMAAGVGQALQCLQAGGLGGAREVAQAWAASHQGAVARTADAVVALSAPPAR